MFMESVRSIRGLKVPGRFLLSLAAIGVIGLAGTVVSPQANAQVSTASARTAVAAAAPSAADDGRRVPAGFTEQKTKVGDVSINYVRGGHGKTLVLLHGYPQTWYTWREVLPELA